jgi:transposase-like protein
MGMGSEIVPNAFTVVRVSAFLIDETMLHIGTDEVWLWVAVELI